MLLWLVRERRIPNRYFGAISSFKTLRKASKKKPFTKRLAWHHRLWREFTYIKVEYTEKENVEE